MIPLPPSQKPLAFYDTECFPNLWLLKFKAQGGVILTFTLRAGQRLSERDCVSIRFLFETFTVVSFNGIYYDVPMVNAALSGYTTEQLKWLNDQIIVEQVKPWELGLSEWKPSDHIDIIEVAPGAGSQKTYAGRIHCKRMQDLPFDPNRHLSESEIVIVDDYCGNDLEVLEAIFDALAPQIQIRISLTERYGIDLRSKSDAQLGESIIKHRCEQALGRRIYKPDIDWNMKFRYDPPAFLQFSTPQLIQAFDLVRNSIFSLGASGSVEMPLQIADLAIGIGCSVYKLGIGGLHSQEKCRSYKSNETHVLRDIDVASYYPNLILNSGEYPEALGPMMLEVYAAMKEERLRAKILQKHFEKAGFNCKDRSHEEGYRAYCENEGGKVGINGPFGKLGSPYSPLFAPKMLIQTTVTGQLALLMLIEWFEHYGITVVSANTDGIVTYCPRHLVATADALIKEWETRTGLEMEMTEYRAIYSRDVNNYFAVKTDGTVKRKGQYAPAGLVEKKNPNTEICSDAVAEYLSKGTPLLYTIAACQDIRKFVKIQLVAGGAVKLWGEGPRKIKVVDMASTLLANGWSKSGRKWERNGETTDATSAYKLCFAPQRPETLGKVIRWYYSPAAPGPIVYASNGNMVSLSYGAKPCMILPDTLPTDIDYLWYLQTAEEILKELGVQ